MSPSMVDRFLCARTVAVLLSAMLLGVPAGAQTDDKAIDAMLNDANRALTAGRPLDAISILNKAIGQAPAHADLYLVRARARDAIGRYQAAIDDANRYIELRPDDAYGYLSRARVYLSMEKREEALQDANKAIELAPDEPDGYYRRADVYYDMGRDAAAKADEAKANALDDR